MVAGMNKQPASSPSRSMMLLPNHPALWLDHTDLPPIQLPVVLPALLPVRLAGSDCSIKLNNSIGDV
ncbi:MAG: hypothetical protein WBI23_08640, partial [Methanothrix sp.]